jgi:catechol 2,3-dioxygenase-like lactoylglutathione lyase family enzyme
MAKVTELGYIGIGVSDAAAWKEYATQVVGMELLDEGEGDRFYLRLDDWHHRIIVHTSGEDDLLYLGWRVAGPAELQQMEAHLREARVPYRVGSEKEASERRVLGLLMAAALERPGRHVLHGEPVRLAVGDRLGGAQGH